jgi:hypothetical protein
MNYPIYGSEKDINNLEEGLYLGLFHGFKNETERAQAGCWGEGGPIIGPLKFVHTTYGTDVKFEFDDPTRHTVYGFTHQDDYLTINSNGCIIFNRMEYGDWTVFYHKK